MCRKIRIRQKQSSIHLRRVFSVFKIGKRIICNIHSLIALNQEKTFVAVKQLQFRTSSSNSAIVRVHCEGSWLAVVKFSTYHKKFEFMLHCNISCLLLLQNEYFMS